MKYDCGHLGCDICGARECVKGKPKLEKVGSLLVCDYCKLAAVKFAYEAACRFGGTVIDISKPCEGFGANRLTVAEKGQA